MNQAFHFVVAVIWTNREDDGSVLSVPAELHIHRLCHFSINLDHSIYVSIISVFTIYILGASE